MPSAPMLPRMLRPCASLLSREQRSSTPKLSKKPRSPEPAPSWRPKLLTLWPSGILRLGGPPRPNYSRGNMAKSCETWSSKTSNRKAIAKVTSSLLARLPYMPTWWSSKACWWLPTRFCWGRPLHPTHSPCCKGPPQQRNSLLQQLLLHLCPSSLPVPKGGILCQILWTASLWVEPCTRQPQKSPPAPKDKRSHPGIRHSSRAAHKCSARTRTW